MRGVVKSAQELAEAVTQGSHHKLQARLTRNCLPPDGSKQVSPRAGASHGTRGCVLGCEVRMRRLGYVSAGVPLACSICVSCRGSRCRKAQLEEVRKKLNNLIL